MQTANDTRSRIEPETFTLRFERKVSASAEQVFAAWTEPEQMKEWWDPNGAPLAECTIDLRPGGAFRFVNQDNAHAPPFEGVYRVVEPPTKLVFDAMGAVGTVLLETRGVQTHVTVTIQCPSAAHLAQLVAVGVEAGTNQTLDNLTARCARAANRH